MTIYKAHPQPKNRLSEKVLKMVYSSKFAPTLNYLRNYNKKYAHLLH
jgi:hypothetical protein